MLTTGMFTYGPGRVPPPVHLGLPETLIAGSFSMGGAVPTIPQEQQDKRLYTSDLAATVTAGDFKKFFNDLMVEKKLDEEEGSGDAVVEAGIDPGKKFAFLEVSLSSFTLVISSESRAHGLHHANVSSALPRWQLLQLPSTESSTKARPFHYNAHRNSSISIQHLAEAI